MGAGAGIGKRHSSNINFNIISPKVIDTTNIIRYDERSLTGEMVNFYENAIEKCACWRHDYYINRPARFYRAEQ